MGIVNKEGRDFFFRLEREEQSFFLFYFHTAWARNEENSLPHILFFMALGTGKWGGGDVLVVCSLFVHEEGGW